MDAKRVQLDGTGLKMLVNKRTVYSTFAIVQGTLPATTLSAILSYDGKRAYTFDSDLQLHTFDLNVAATGAPFPELGSAIPLAGNPGTTSNGDDIRMALSHDDKVLFIAGSSKVIVQPLP